VNRLLVLRYAFANGWTELRRDTWPPGWLLRIVSQAAFFALLGELAGSAARTEYLLIGNIVASGVLATAIAVPQSTWDRTDGTYALLVVAPTSLLFPTVGRTLCRLVAGVATSLAAFVVLSLLFDLPSAWPEVLGLIPLFVVTCTGAYCLMLFAGALANYAPRARNLVHNLLTMSLMAFCGVNVATSFWPEWLQMLARGLPLTHGLLAIRELFGLGDVETIVSNALLEVLVGLVWLLLAALAIDRMANAGRSSGSIEFVS
jgi:ABC-2 type transport system permease protein